MGEHKKNNDREGLEGKGAQLDKETVAAKVAGKDEAPETFAGAAPEPATEDKDTVETVLASVKAELADKIAALEELQQRYLRLQADFDNYRKRTRREQEEFTKMATAGLITGILPILDNLERALAAASEAKETTLVAGVEMILRQLKEVLALEGLRPIEAVGQPFNPELHEAVSREETNDQEKINLVLEEYRQGYTLQGKLLRPAMVKVAIAAEPGKQEKDTESGE